MKENGGYTDGVISCSDDLAADIEARHTSEKFYGYDTWVSGHRNGESGLENPGTDDIKSTYSVFPSSWQITFGLILYLSAAYQEAIEWIRQQLESDELYLSDDTRFWVDVTPI